MATEKTYYTIDPEGKLTCMKCKVKLRKGNAKFMYLDRVIKAKYFERWYELLLIAPL